MLGLALSIGYVGIKDMPVRRTSYSFRRDTVKAKTPIRRLGSYVYRNINTCNTCTHGSLIEYNRHSLFILNTLSRTVRSTTAETVGRELRREEGDRRKIVGATHQG